MGLRFTLTLDNADQLPEMLRLMDDEDIDKFYLSHLVYAGRGNKNRASDAAHETTRRAMDLLFDACWDLLERGRPKEFVTGNNDADGVYLLRWVERHFPDRATHLRAKLAAWGGNASGVNVANIDNLGNVHPDTYWWHYNLGNVRERPFSQIWPDVSDPIMAGSNSGRGLSRGAAAAARSSTSAAATHACARFRSPGILGRRTRAVT